jgi:CheY-like chemotaxis protein
MVLREALLRCGVSVNEASSGADGLAELGRASAANTPYQMVLLDCRMPEMDGFEVAAQIQSNLRLPVAIILMLTSDIRSGDLNRAREMGVTTILVKPVKRAALLEATVSAMQKTDSIPQRAIACYDSPALESHYRQRILIAEDNEDNLFLIKEYLEDQPYEFDVAQNGKMASDKAISRHYDLILMDIQMSVMDGYSATNIIRNWERERHLAPIPILALTADPRATWSGRFCSCNRFSDKAT